MQSNCSSSLTIRFKHEYISFRLKIVSQEEIRWIKFFSVNSSSNHISALLTISSWRYRLSLLTGWFEEILPFLESSYADYLSNILFLLTAIGRTLKLDQIFTNPIQSNIKFLIVLVLINQNFSLIKLHYSYMTNILAYKINFYNYMYDPKTMWQVFSYINIHTLIFFFQN